MAWGELTLTRLLLLLVLPAPFAAADANAKNSEARADPRPPAAGSAADGLAYDPIQKTTTYTDNATAAGAPPVDGWWESKICSGDYCVYTNRRVAQGRSLALVTKFDEFQKLERMEDHLDRGENRFYEDPAPFVETEVFEKGVGLTAAKTLRRGKPLMSWSPVLVVHQALFDDVVKKKERARLLEAAVSLLPEATRAKFDRQRARPGGNPIPRTVEEILQSQPFEIDLGFGTYRRQGADAPPPPHSRHYANYPEAARLQHDCRPSVAHHIDEGFSLRATVARRLQPGDELSITYVDPLLPRAERAEWVRRHRGYGGPCPCRACNPPGGEGDEAARKEDERLKELLEIRGELRNPDSTKVTLGMIERFLKLVEEERLHVKFAEAYELAALNFNYLGDDKRAKKYADYAVQAGIIEGGPTSNDVVAMRVMASDIKGHYSYQFTLKRRGQVPK